MYFYFYYSISRQVSVSLSHSEMATSKFRFITEHSFHIDEREDDVGRRVYGEINARMRSIACCNSFAQMRTRDMLPPPPAEWMGRVLCTCVPMYIVVLFSERGTGTSLAQVSCNLWCFVYECSGDAGAQNVILILVCCERGLLCRCVIDRVHSGFKLCACIFMLWMRWAN